MSSKSENTLRSTFLEALPSAERDHIFTLTGELSVFLMAWSKKYPTLMRTRRVPQVSLTMAVSAPFLSARELLPTASLFMWLFAVDDLCDEAPPGEQAASDAPLWTRIEQAVSVFREPDTVSPGGEEPLRQSLRDIRDGLAHFPLFASLRAPLESSLRDFLRGTRHETAWSARYRQSPHGPLPSLEDYLEKGACYTSGTLPIYLGVLTSINEDAILPRLPHFMGLGHEAAISIRLANDLRSYEKELAEGKLNSLVLFQRELMAQHGMDSTRALARARAEVRTHLVDAMERCMQSGTEEASAGSRATQAIVNAAAFACDFYAHHDFHPPVVPKLTPSAST
ncbi:terpene synthase family protein [Stigmatella sp. ncwal1]|uniref:Terpene synthase family protein n=1 Tax=Stigmatella ashevillensis TaxID=2995309 RepID=A0ABT5DEN1_9BACT|nr:terpene synthase family protein [Stigmatella ashevillena]MDC0712039.1 terpene synthase family protein [Stigmatella ashevillena]